MAVRSSHSAGEQRTASRHVYSVSELLAGLSGLIDDQVGRVWTSGEISNLHRARSGHSYFSLKDDRGQIRCALFRSAAARVPFELEDGIEVEVYADVSIYAARGELQLVVRTVEPRGAGALQLAFEQLRRRLEAAGLFDAERKRRPPRLPRRIGIVTSPTSAALRDVLEVTGRRMPGVPLLVSPTQVQGASAAREVADAIAALADQDVDVVLVVRGGGSLEDLQAFNSEVVARAIADCPHPVICGVGHEVDVTIADLVADVRAPTPSAAAERVLPHRDELRGEVAQALRGLVSAGTRVQERKRARLQRERDALRALSPAARVATWRARLAAARRALPQAFAVHPARARERLRASTQTLVHALERHPERARARLEAAARALGPAAARRPERERARLASLAAQLDSLSPLAVLGRGYAMARASDDGRVLHRASEVAPGDGVRVRLAEGELETQVVRVSSDPGELD
jgi:exodeoxyribonuclease VII large subunit